MLKRLSKILIQIFILVLFTTAFSVESYASTVTGVQEETGDERLSDNPGYEIIELTPLYPNAKVWHLETEAYDWSGNFYYMEIYKNDSWQNLEFDNRGVDMFFNNSDVSKVRLRIRDSGYGFCKVQYKIKWGTFINDYDEFNDLKNIVNDIKTDASQAKTSADAAKSSADKAAARSYYNSNTSGYWSYNAYSKANSANSNASAAKTNAANAKSSADTAATNAANANSNASAAKTEAAAAKNAANAAAGDATYIRSTQLPNVENKIDNLETVVANIENNMSTGDSAPPSIMSVKGYNGATCTTGTTFKVVVKASDNSSDSLEFRVKADSGSWSNWTSISNYAVATGISGGGAHTINVEVRDQAGNAANDTMTVFKI
ncbi:MAG: hypothetical protein FH756_00440 [Firmicutes bacterium]|nr:hypothetical protein [Bacillota bacterium]